MNQPAAGPWRTDEPPKDEMLVVDLGELGFGSDVHDGKEWKIWGDDVKAWAEIYPYKEGE